MDEDGLLPSTGCFCMSWRMGFGENGGQFKKTGDKCQRFEQSSAEVDVGMLHTFGRSSCRRVQQPAKQTQRVVQRKLDETVVVWDDSEQRPYPIWLKSGGDAALFHRPENLSLLFFSLVKRVTSLTTFKSRVVWQCQAGVDNPLGRAGFACERWPCFLREECAHGVLTLCWVSPHMGLCVRVAVSCDGRVFLCAPCAFSLGRQTRRAACRLPAGHQQRLQRKC